MKFYSKTYHPYEFISYIKFEVKLQINVKVVGFILICLYYTQYISNSKFSSRKPQRFNSPKNSFVVLCYVTKKKKMGWTAWFPRMIQRRHNLYNKPGSIIIDLRVWLCNVSLYWHCVPFVYRQISEQHQYDINIAIRHGEA